MSIPSHSEARQSRLIFWFGAGISGASGMPMGAELTLQWLKHHLPLGEDLRILDFYHRLSGITGKQNPRLEQVIEDAIAIFGSECLANLDFFRHCLANQVHRTIADYLVQERCYAVTTNFDDALEGYRTELPVITPTTGVNHSWGLVKIHGSIGESPERLGHSISNLQEGLDPAIRELLLSILNDPDNVILFLGYGGGDFLDVWPMFDQQTRSDAPFGARAIWLHHEEASSAEWTGNDEAFEEILGYGPQVMMAAFSATKNRLLVGNTSQLLARFLPLNGDPSPCPSQDWRIGWSERFCPNPDDMRCYAAKLFASFGAGSSSLACLKPSSLSRDRMDREHQLWMNALRDCGCYEAELMLRRWAMDVGSTTYSLLFKERQLAASLRLSGRFFQAFRIYWSFVKRYAVPSPPTSEAERTQQIWAVAEAGLFAQSPGRRLAAVQPTATLTRPVQLGLRYMVMRCLRIIHQSNENGLVAHGPHLQGMIHRLSGFLTDYSGWSIPFIEKLLYKDLLPVVDAAEGRDWFYPGLSISQAGWIIGLAGIWFGGAKGSWLLMDIVRDNR